MSDTQTRVFTPDNRPRILRKGDVVEETLAPRPGARTVTITTPCCQVPYRLDLETVEAHIDRFKGGMPQGCGKRLHGRGNKPGDPGCHWPYTVEFVRDGEGYKARWIA